MLSVRVSKKISPLPLCQDTAIIGSMHYGKQRLSLWHEAIVSSLWKLGLTPNVLMCFTSYVSISCLLSFSLFLKYANHLQPINICAYLYLQERSELVKSFCLSSVRLSGWVKPASLRCGCRDQAAALASPPSDWTLTTTVKCNYYKQRPAAVTHLCKTKM